MIWGRRAVLPTTCCSCITDDWWNVRRQRRFSPSLRVGRAVRFLRDDCCGERRPLMRCRRLLIALTAAMGAVVLTLPAVAAERFITVASTTSTENSGLFGHLLPRFQR